MYTVNKDMRQECEYLAVGPKKVDICPRNTFIHISVILSFQLTKLYHLSMRAIILLVFCFSVCTGAPICPLLNSPGSVYSGQIMAALNGGTLPLIDDQDTVCYNYSLPYQFGAPPQTAIGVHDFQLQPSNNLFFFIKTIKSQSLSMVPFVVRTQWSYSKWTQISFTFLAEDRTDIQLGYYQIDSGSLSNCQQQKQISILLPFRNLFNFGKQIRHHLFLHGFQIATVSLNSTRSPFQLQIVSSYANLTGISSIISVTTSTKINSIYVSYMAYQQLKLSVAQGSYVYDASIDRNQIYFAPSTPIAKNYARIYGITGFIINYHRQQISFWTNWDGVAFLFDFKNNRKYVQYLSYRYVFFVGSECDSCIGYPISYSNVCVSECPVGTFKTALNTCIICGNGREYDGSKCINSCPKGQYLSPVSGLCECPLTLHWNGQACVPCTAGKVWNQRKTICECPKPLSWNGLVCVKLQQCKDGKVWDVNTYTCVCPQATYWSANQCKSFPICRGGQVIDVLTYSCVCPNGYIWNQDQCQFSPCFGGQIWTGSRCMCPVGLNFNGSMCLQCINGQKWNSKKLVCECESGYKWNTQICQRSYDCKQGNRVWSQIYQQCICQDGTYWSGYTCLPNQNCTGGQYFDSTISKCVCLSGFQWNGTMCVQCVNGRVWNVTTLTCTCPPGTLATKNGCMLQQMCGGGKQWIQNVWSCQCPEGSVWNGKYCIANACTNGRIWNDTLKACQCLDNKAWINQSCVPQQIVCTGGKVWNPYIYACECPQGTYSGALRCEYIPTCNNGKVYNPLNNQCQCPFGLVQRYSQCVAQNCSDGQFWAGYQCQLINCPAPTYFGKGRCIYGNYNNCQFGYYWNGQKCVYYPNNCPTGTKWNGISCQGSGNCSSTGYYLNSNGECVPLPQQCTPPAQWNGQACVISNGKCPQGTYLSYNKCLPMTACKNGYVWDSNYLRCICPAGTIGNGVSCIECPNQQKWMAGVGCSCPDGSFDVGTQCETITRVKCGLISNSFWDAGRCLCRPGFTKSGLQCICQGAQIGDYCDKCSYKPNSYYTLSDTCQCKQGYTQIQKVCVPNSQIIANEDPTKCGVSTYFDQNHKMCLACPDGCLSCINCYKCKLCRPEFVFDYATQKCVQLCGDGKKFVVECDDGNNMDGDGCSRDCKIERGYTCKAGSPDSKDNCYIYRPDKITFTQIGQIRKSTSIVLNLQLNYVPANLMASQDCSNKCNQILVGTIVDGDKSSISITSELLTATKNIFTMTIEFGRPYIAKFKISIAINPTMTKYFTAYPVQPIQITVQPSYLSAIRQDKQTAK